MLLEAAEQLLAGGAFGAALTVSGVALPSIIQGQFELTNFHMLQVFATAMGSGALVMILLDRLGVVKRPTRPNAPFGSRYGGNILGGSMVGLGMSLTGACPGTVLVQLAQGLPSAKAVGIGAVLGGASYSYLKPRLAKSAEDRHLDCTKTSIPAALGTSERVVYAALGATILATLLATRRFTQSPGMEPIFGGLTIGLAQAVSLLITSAPLGVSTAYEQVGQYILEAAHVKSSGPKTMPKALVFAVAVIAGSFLTRLVTGASSLASYESTTGFWEAVMGGFILVFGARLAGGCTSGHGLSGTSGLSYSSLITTAAMFGTGILSRQMIVAFRAAQ